MQIVLFDHSDWRRDFYPLSLTRPVSNLRTGILTLDEKWNHWLKYPVSYYTAPHLRELFPLKETDAEIYLIRGNVLPDQASVAQVSGLRTGEMLKDDLGLWAGRLPARHLREALDGTFEWKEIDGKTHPDFLQYPEDLFRKNGQEIQKDYQLLTQGRVSGKLSNSNQILGDQLFVEEGVRVECATINTLQGPVYLGKNSQVFEGCNLRGPFALGEGSVLKMGAQVYSNVSIGPYSTLGGELNTCVVWGFSAKGHAGYFGSGVMGAWCNWGAGSSNSNLKNNYGSVSLYDYTQHSQRDTGLQVCGLIMGDYVRCAINTSFYTGTVIGAGVNLATSRSIDRFVPDFTWQHAEHNSTYRLDKLFETLKLVFQRRNRIFGESEQNMLQAAFALTEEFRHFKDKSLCEKK